MKKLSRVLIAICLVVFVVSCANLGTAVKEDPYKAANYSYLQMLEWYTQSAETYNVHYQLADEATKAKWKEEIDPIFLKIKSALDVWKLALSQGDLGNDQYQQIKNLKSTLLAYGLTFLEE